MSRRFEIGKAFHKHTQCHQSLNFRHNTVTHVARPKAMRVTGGIAYKMEKAQEASYWRLVPNVRKC